MLRLGRVEGEEGGLREADTRLEAPEPHEARDAVLLEIQVVLVPHVGIHLRQLHLDGVPALQP